MAKWQNAGEPGIRFRTHAIRKHGVKFDRYFSIWYKSNSGKRKEEGIGWASNGIKLSICTEIREQITKNIKSGKGPQTYAEMKTQRIEKREAEEQLKRKVAKAQLTFADFFKETYWPIAKTSKKESSFRKEAEHFKNWIDPEIGHLQFKEICQIQIEKIKSAMLKKNLSMRSIQYVLSTTQQIWKLAIESGLTSKKSPTTKVRVGKINNERTRFLTISESKLLLDALKERSESIYQISLLSLDCGLRFKEIAKLTFGDLNFERESIFLQDTKPSNNRTVFMTKRVKEMLNLIPDRGKHELIFTDANGKLLVKISHTFPRIVKEIGLNEGVTDHRQKVVFHTLRHTYASRLVEKGVDLYVVQKLLGHGQIKMTERYSHLRLDTLKDAVGKLDDMQQETLVIDIKNRGNGQI